MLFFDLFVVSKLTDDFFLRKRGTLNIVRDATQGPTYGVDAAAQHERSTIYGPHLPLQPRCCGDLRRERGEEARTVEAQAGIGLAAGRDVAVCGDVAKGQLLAQSDD